MSHIKRGTQLCWEHVWPVILLYYTLMCASPYGWRQMYCSTIPSHIYLQDVHEAVRGDKQPVVHNLQVGPLFTVLSLDVPVLLYRAEAIWRDTITSIFLLVYSEFPNLQCDIFKVLNSLISNFHCHQPVYSFHFKYGVRLNFVQGLLQLSTTWWLACLLHTWNYNLCISRCYLIIILLTYRSSSSWILLDMNMTRESKHVSRTFSFGASKKS